MFARLVLKRSFALDNTRTLTRHIQDRVMSTPQWPVPYYERQYNGAKVSESSQDDLSCAGREICMTDVKDTKHMLNTTVQGRQILQHFENHAKVDSYIVRQNDTGNMAKAYCADLIKYLDVANKENKRILNTTDLL